MHAMPTMLLKKEIYIFLKKKKRKKVICSYSDHTCNIHHYDLGNLLLKNTKNKRHYIKFP